MIKTEIVIYGINHKYQKIAGINKFNYPHIIIIYNMIHFSHVFNSKYKKKDNKIVSLLRTGGKNQYTTVDSLKRYLWHYFRNM